MSVDEHSLGDPVGGDYSPLLEPGTTVGRGQYVVAGVCGTGGMATVYLVRHVVLESEHALKVLAPDLAREESHRERFLAEGRILAQLKHPNLVSVTDVVVEKGGPGLGPGVAGLVQEYLRGETLEEHLDRRGALPIEEIVAILGPVLEAVHQVHEAGIVHRDLKPSNIFLETQVGGAVRPVVLDFGIARVTSEAAIRHQPKRRTRTGATLGTAHYMSPEQVRASGSVDRRTDVFALGAVLFEMITGHVAFDGDSEFDVMRRIVDGELVRGQDLPPVEPRLDAVVQRAIASRPEDRFVDCLEFASMLRGQARPKRRVRRRVTEVEPAGRREARAPAKEDAGGTAGSSFLHRMAELLLGVVGAESAFGAAVLAVLISDGVEGWPRLFAYLAAAVAGAPGLYLFYRGVLFGLWQAERPLVGSGALVVPWDAKLGLKARFKPAGLGLLRGLLCFVPALLFAGLMWVLWSDKALGAHALWPLPMVAALLLMALEHGWMGLRFLLVGWGRRPARSRRRRGRKRKTRA